MFLRVALWVIVFTFFVEQGSAEENHHQTLNGKLVLTGSSTIAPLVGEIGKRFEKIHPGVRVNVQTGGSSRGVSDSRNKLNDIGMVSRELKSTESDLKSYPIALDGIGVIVNSQNTVTGLKKEQVVSIFNGNITNWQQVGGRNRPITVVNKAEGRSTLELFLNYTALKAREIKAHIIIGDNEQGIKTIAGNKDAVGYVSVGSAEFAISNGVKIKLLPEGSTAASLENIKSGAYKLSRPLNLVTIGKTSMLVDAFIKFAQSKEVHDIVQEQYFIPIGVPAKI